MWLVFVQLGSRWSRNAAPCSQWLHHFVPTRKVLNGRRVPGVCLVCAWCVFPQLAGSSASRSLACGCLSDSGFVVGYMMVRFPNEGCGYT